jgi:hypothetical protein
MLYGYSVFIKRITRRSRTKMKKTILAVLFVAAAGVIGLQQASARVFDHREDGAPRFQQLDDATKAKMEKFRTDTLDLRKQMAMKRAEEVALIRSETPDMDAVRKTAGELFDLRMAMQEKAKAAGLFTHRKGATDDKKIAGKFEKFEKFLTDTQDLRKQMVVKGAEERALMHSRNVNTEMVAKVAGELFDLRTALHEKARAAGLAAPFRGMGREGMGPGRHFRHGGESGMMECPPEPHGLGMIGAGVPMDEEDTI